MHWIARRYRFERECQRLIEKRLFDDTSCYECYTSEIKSQARELAGIPDPQPAPHLGRAIVGGLAGLISLGAGCAAYRVSDNSFVITGAAFMGGLSAPVICIGATYLGDSLATKLYHRALDKHIEKRITQKKLQKIKF